MIGIGERRPLVGVFVAGGGALFGTHVGREKEQRRKGGGRPGDHWYACGRGSSRAAESRAATARLGGSARGQDRRPQPEPSSSAAVVQRARPPAAPSRSRRAPRRRRGRARPLVGAGDAGELRPWSEQTARATSAPSGPGSRQPRAPPRACAAGRRAQALPRAAVLTGQTRGKRGKGADRWPPLPRVGHVRETTIQNRLMVNCE